MKLLTQIVALISLLAFSFVALAAEAVAVDKAWLIENWPLVITAILYALSHVMAVLPIGAKWPTMLKQIADFLSANYGNTKNADKK